jgi:hypothetical protein
MISAFDRNPPREGFLSEVIYSVFDDVAYYASDGRFYTDPTHELVIVFSSVKDIEATLNHLNKLGCGCNVACFQSAKSRFRDGALR